MMNRKELDRKFGKHANRHSAITALLAEWERVVMINALTSGNNDTEWEWCFSELLALGVEPVAIAAAADRAFIMAVERA